MTPVPAVKFPYVDRDPSLLGSGLMPFLPLILTLEKRSVSVAALLDTGAAVNVLPYDVGLQLGAEWGQQTARLQLAGNLARSEARALFLEGTIGPFPPARVAFAWTRDNSVSVILGQTNFFEQFDVCFFRSRAIFEVRPCP